MAKIMVHLMNSCLLVAYYRSIPDTSSTYSPEKTYTRKCTEMSTLLQVEKVATHEEREQSSLRTRNLLATPRNHSLGKNREVGTT